MPLIARSGVKNGTHWTPFPDHWVGGDRFTQNVGPVDGNSGQFLEGRGSYDNLRGGGGDDSLAGQRGDDLLDGGSGNDTLDGGLEVDTLLGGSGNDTMDGGNQNDTLAGGSGSDTVWGGYGDDVIYGSGHTVTVRTEEHDISSSTADDFAPDLLYGGSGNDRIEVWAGDSAWGGTGADRFVVMGEVDTLEAALQIIKDFKAGVDVIEFG